VVGNRSLYFHKILTTIKTTSTKIDMLWSKKDHAY